MQELGFIDLYNESRDTKKGSFVYHKCKDYFSILGFDHDTKAVHIEVKTLSFNQIIKCAKFLKELRDE